MQLRKLQFYIPSRCSEVRPPFTLYMDQQQQLTTTNFELNMIMLDAHY